jgi:pilus assembly protein CpaC
MTQHTHNTGRSNGYPIARSLAVIGGAALAILLSVRASTGQDAAPGAAAPAAPAADTLVHQGTDNQGAVRIMLNKSQVLQTKVPYKRLSVAQPEIADVNPLGPTTILVTGKKVGSTQVIVWDDQDRSQVMDVLVGFDLADLQDQLKKSFPAARIEAATTGNNVLLKGRVPNLQVAEQARVLASGYSDKVMDFMEVSGGQQVMLKVRFAEVSKAATTSLGFSGFLTDGTADFGSINGPGGDPIGGVVNRDPDTTIDPGVTIFGRGELGSVAFEYFLSALRQNNLLRVLAEPNLVTMSGQKASFLAGGEFPIPVPQDGGDGGTTITIEYKEFGVRLNFVPVVLGDGRIRLEVAPEVSELDFTNAVFFNGFRIPALTTRNVRTTVELSEGQTLAIAGLLNNRVTANKEAVPLLGDIPVLGALFRSTRYERRETELVVLVSPVLVEAMNPDQVGRLPGEDWRHPGEPEQLLLADIGGEAPAADAARPAPRYQGRHGFVPATPTTNEAK